ncbi:MAG TPA: class I SAM-dependent methyltransferase, partial [Candidatus Mcinerneyibacteriales bacterium]|nr:class I SAM-dependent methyltransferase [Candidatus Mcinerneyibacteriales bacterium]
MNRIEEFYDEFSDYLIQDYIIVNPRHQKIRSFLKQEFFFHKHQSVLELGCGAGVLTGFFLKRKTRVTAVDISGKNISVARAIHGKGPFLQGDILKLDLGQSYDFIALFDVIEHIPEDRLKDLISVIESHTHESSRLALTFPFLCILIILKRISRNSFRSLMRLFPSAGLSGDWEKSVLHWSLSIFSGHVGQTSILLWSWNGAGTFPPGLTGTTAPCRSGSSKKGRDAKNLSHKAGTHEA